MNSSPHVSGADVSKLKKRALELELELEDIETGWLKRRKIRKELKQVKDELELKTK